MGRNSGLLQSWAGNPQVEDELETKTRTELLRVTFSYLSYAIVGNFIATASLVIGSWATNSPAVLLSWAGAMLLFNGMRWLVAKRLPVGELSESVRQKWDRSYLITAFLSGALWGFAGWYFFIPDDSGHNFFLALYVISMSAAAATSLSYHRVAYVAFCLPAIGPLMLRLVMEDGIPEQTVGFVIPLYFFFMILLSRHIYKAAAASISARILESHLAYHDHLTGVANRRYFEEALNREWSRAQRAAMSLSLIILDIDNFKRVNDIYGHAAGDDVLQLVAGMIAQRVREGGDLVARIGGEEFAVLLSDTDAAGASKLAEELCSRARTLQSRVEENCPPSTLSAGVASCIPDGAMMPETLINLADKALYRAKSQGKDRVETCTT
jgi:diguanylate cyclase (GGDEF)-like protein